MHNPNWKRLREARTTGIVDIKRGNEGERERRNKGPQPNLNQECCSSWFQATGAHRGNTWW